MDPEKVGDRMWPKWAHQTVENSSIKVQIVFGKPELTVEIKVAA